MDKNKNWLLGHVAHLEHNLNAFFLFSWHAARRIIIKKKYTYDENVKIVDKSPVNLPFIPSRWPKTTTVFLFL